jgi:hypothetical protein
MKIQEGPRRMRAAAPFRRGRGRAGTTHADGGRRRIMGRVMRQRFGVKKVARLQRETGLPIIGVLVRGGTGHRRDLMLPGGTVVHMYKDGSRELASIQWYMRKALPERTA